jgi:LysM repeat protein
MKKPLGLVLLLAALAFTSGCTSGGSEEEGDFADGSEATEELADSDASLDEAGSADADQAFLEDTQTDTAATTETTSDALAADPLAPPADTFTPTEPAPEVAATEPPPPPAETPVEEMPSSADSSTVTAIDESKVSEEVKKVYAPLQKIDKVPRIEDGVALNAVYIARPGDTMKKVSEKIYASDKVDQLKKWNPSLKAKLKPGQKLYYNSPNRTSDTEKVLVYFEDAGVPAEVYTAKDGDNIRQVSENLLGYKDAWKEVWATNEVESKGALIGDTKLAYWKSAPEAAPAETVTPLPPVADMPPPPPPMEEPVLPPPPPFEASLPPPPVQDLPPPMPSQASLDLPPPPPPVEEPPPPTPRKQEVVGDSLDNETLMSIAGVGLLVIAFAIYMMYRRKNSQRKEMDAVFSETQVGS